MNLNECDKCGKTISDLDAGFSPGLHNMKCVCGGTWRKVSEVSVAKENINAQQ